MRVLGETAGNRQTGKATVLSQGCDGGCGVSWWVVPVDSAFPLLLSLKAKDVSQGSYPPVPASAGSRFSPQPPVSPHPLVQVDSLSVTPGPLGVPELMVSQPGWERFSMDNFGTFWLSPLPPPAPVSSRHCSQPLP